MKKLTMQEFADTFGVYVAKDKSDQIYMFTRKPVIKEEEFSDCWDFDERAEGDMFSDITYLLEDSSTAWEQSLCTPQKGAYATPCGCFNDGEKVAIDPTDEIGTYKFITYSSFLEKPYVCICDDDSYLNTAGGPHIVALEKIYKVFPKVYRPYKEVSFDWLGKKVVDAGNPDDVKEINYLGYSDYDKKPTIITSDREKLTLEEAYESLNWEDTKAPFGELVEEE